MELAGAQVQSVITADVRFPPAVGRPSRNSPLTPLDMVKHSVLSMEKFFTRERFGQPQFLAGMMLLMFLAQCAWLIGRSLSGLDIGEAYRINEGLRQLHGGRIAGTPSATPLPQDDE